MEKKVGIIKWFDRERGYGFISYDGRAEEEGWQRRWPLSLLRRFRAKPTEDVFIHYSAIEGGVLRLLNEGQRVEFLVQENGLEGPQAVQVRVL
jgi:CspA family cold shock protein